jgi:hypothetical protein
MMIILGHPGDDARARDSADRTKDEMNTVET